MERDFCHLVVSLEKPQKNTELENRLRFSSLCNSFFPPSNPSSSENSKIIFNLNMES